MALTLRAAVIHGGGCVSVCSVGNDRRTRTYVNSKGVAPYRAGPAMAVPIFKDHTHCTPLMELNIEVISTYMI